MGGDRKTTGHGNTVCREDDAEAASAKACLPSSAAQAADAQVAKALATSEQAKREQLAKVPATGMQTAAVQAAAAPATTAQTAGQSKAALRRTCLAVAHALLPKDCAESAAQICAQLLRLPSYQAAKTVFCFVGTAHEIDTTEFLQTVLNDGKILCVPFCAQGEQAVPTGIMHAKRVQLLCLLRPGAFGIAAPPESAQTVLAHTIDLAVLPCVAAEATGVRLGYGGGYYDRYLPQLAPACTTVTLCRKLLLLPPHSVPVQPHDICVQHVLTEEGLVGVPDRK